MNSKTLFFIQLAGILFLFMIPVMAEVFVQLQSETGDFTVDGNLNVTGNLTYYGSMWFNNDSGTGFETVINTQGVYENVTGFNQTTGSGHELNGFIWNNSQEYLQVVIEGKYKADWTLSFERSSGAVVREYNVALAINDILQNRTKAHRSVSNVNDVGSSAGTGFLLDLVEDDRIQLQIANIDGTENVGVHVASVNLMRVGN